MAFVHLAPSKIAPGSVIEAGNFGRIVGLFGYKHNWFNREQTLEQVRSQVAPNAPSRMRCLFAFSTAHEASLFRVREFQGFAVHHLYVVEPLAAETPVFYAPLSAIEVWQPNNVDAAARYWNQGHMAGDAPVLPKQDMAELAVTYEVLIGGDVRVLERVG